jgi:signal peptidase II
VIESRPAIGPSPASRSFSRRLSARWRNDLTFFFIAATIVVLDQFTKWLVRSNLSLYETWDWSSRTIAGIDVRIVHVVNSGAAFGILQGQTPFLIGTSLVGLLAILLYYVYPPMEHGLIRVALGMQLGGAIGNLIDRVRMGEVTDFVDVGTFPTFNVADASISTSIAAVLIFFVLEEGRARQQPEPAQAPPAGED